MATIPTKDIKFIGKLYYKNKLSVPLIAKKFGVSNGSVYYLMRKHGLLRRDLFEQNVISFERKAPSFKLNNDLTLKERELKLIGTMLYWAEGFQSEKADIVDFANSKPAMIIIFLNFLRKVCGVDESRLRAYLYCYSNQEVNQLVEFWSRVTNISRNQFTKPYIRHDFNINKIGKMKYGLLHIRYNDKKLLRVIKLWIEEYIEKLCGGGRVVNYTSL